VFGRAPKLPAALRPAFDSGERVLAWTPAGDERVVVVSNRGLWLPDRPRLGWHEIHKATWADGVLTVTGSSLVAAASGDDYSIVTDAPPVRITLADPGKVPQRVRERVTASVAYTSLYPGPGGGSARVVGRRVSGRDGLIWSVRFEGAAVQGQDDPAVRAAVDQFVAEAKSSISVAD
jgi:hypothetical protein